MARVFIMVLGSRAMPAAHEPSLLYEVARALEAAGVDLTALGLAWARTVPVMMIVPAFALRGFPAAARAILGMTLAVAIFPALGAIANARAGVPWPILLAEEALRGVPIAIASAVPLWAATMAGGLVDSFRGAHDKLAMPAVEGGRTTPLGVLLSLLASAIFLSTGGPARLVSALAEPAVPAHPVLAAAHDLTMGVSLAVAIAGPLLVAGVVIDVAAALMVRAAAPVRLRVIAEPLRSFGVLFVFAVVVDRVAAVIAGVMR